MEKSWRKTDAIMIQSELGNHQRKVMAIGGRHFGREQYDEKLAIKKFCEAINQVVILFLAETCRRFNFWR